MNIQKPNTEICQTKESPEVKYTKTNKNEHTKTQYNNMSNKTNPEIQY